MLNPQLDRRGELIHLLTTEGLPRRHVERLLEAARTWAAGAAPAGTPPEVVKVLSDGLSRALKDASVQNAIRKDAAMERDLPLDQFKQYIIQDIANYRKAATPDLLKQIGQ
ncbi:hypothetical protein G6F57_014892 [Rhizopus arrhizus]|nr:hypothetical protein G6F57_014892 [Rhizopus arrhizus]